MTAELTPDWFRQRFALAAFDDGGVVLDVTLSAELSGLPFTASDYLKALAPKVLSLMGPLVLHGSAVSHGDEGIAMCGVSGAGATVASTERVHETGEK